MASNSTRLALICLCICYLKVLYLKADPMCAPQDGFSPGCKPPGSTNTVECSGRGICICNQCECDQRVNTNEIIHGRWCQCDNYSCYRHEGKICNYHGTCDCGKCVCDLPWAGDACECYNATNICYPPYKLNPQLCNGHGTCACGLCQCDSTAGGKYAGRYCEELVSN